MRKLMVHNDVVCSPNSNCPIGSRTKTLTVSSNRPSTSKENLFDPSEMPEDDWLNLDFFEISQYTADAVDHSIAYMASVIEARIMTANRYNKIVKCNQCVAAFIQNTLIEDEFIRFKSRCSNVLQPCTSTFEICKFVESSINSYTGKNISYQLIAKQMLEKMPIETLFDQSSFVGHEQDQDVDHRFDFVKKIVELFMRLKSIETAKRITLQAHDNPLRQKMKKLVQQRGE